MARKIEDIARELTASKASAIERAGGGEAEGKIARLKKALAIVVLGKVLPLSRDCFDVAGTPKRERKGEPYKTPIYSVTPGSCSCGDATHRSAQCKHRIAAWLYREAVAVRLGELRAEQEAAERKARELAAEIAAEEGY